MMKNLYITLLIISLIGVLVIYFQNTVFTSTVYTPIGMTMSSTIVIYTSVLGFIGGFSLKSFLSLKNNDDEDNF